MTSSTPLGLLLTCLLLSSAVSNYNIYTCCIITVLPDYCCIITVILDYCCIITVLLDYCCIITVLLDYCCIITVLLLLLHYHCAPRLLLHYHCAPRLLLHYHCAPRLLLHCHCAPRLLLHYHCAPRLLLHYHCAPRLLLHWLFLYSLQRAVYFLRADFHTYNNALHAYWSPESDSGVCCDGNTFPTNCSTSCNTLLRYCFKIYGTYNDISNDDDILNDCLGNLQFTGVLSTTDYINYTMPPSTFGDSTRTSIFLRGASWPVSYPSRLISYRTTFFYSVFYFSCRERFSSLCGQFTSTVM